MTDNEPFRGMNPVGGASGIEPERSNQPVGQPEGITGYDTDQPVAPETSQDASQGVAERGLFNTFQMGLFDRIIVLIRNQNPDWTYVYADAVIPLINDVALGTMLDVASGLATDLNTNGYIPLLNGFISGYSFTMPEQFPAKQGVKFRLYRNKTATHCHIYITSGDNFTNPDSTAGGAKRTRIYNINPAPIVRDEVSQDVIYFRAGERIAIVREEMDLDGYTDAVINYLQLQIHRVYDVITQDTLNALGIAGGNIGGTPGGGGGGNGDNGEDPIVM